MIAAATWDPRIPRYCEAVCPWSVTSPPRCRRQKWQVTPAVATQVAWTTHVHVRTCTWVVHAMHLGGPLPFMAAAAREQLHDDHSWWELPHSDSIESRTSHGKFISGELTTLTMTLFKFLADSYADAVTTGRLLCQWYADQSDAIHESVVLSNGRRRASDNGTLACAKCPRSHSQLDWDPGCLV